jgi:Fasciclin domain
MSGSSSRRDPDERLHPLRNRSRQPVFQLISARSVVDPGDPAGPFCASIPAEGEGSFVGMADDPVATAASNNPYLTTLSAAVQAAGLVDTLNGEGPFTIFAPSNEAFADVPPSDLDAILADTELLTSVLA